MATTSQPGGAPRTRDVLLAAQLYYEQDLTMDAIASELRTSRSTVSRLLSHARQTGVVEIRVHSPHEEPRQLQGDLRHRYGVTAHIAPVPERISEADRLDRVARSAARTVGAVMQSNARLGIAWGSTMTAVSRHLVAKPTHNATVVQLNGAANTHTSGLEYASEILDRFGSAYQMAVQQFAVPAFFDRPETKRALWDERSIRRVRDLQRGLDIVLFGLGAPFAGVPSHVYSGGYLDDDDYASLADDGVVGDVATMFYRADGTADGIALNERSSGPELDVLRQVPRRICVVAGERKLDALSGALAAGLVTDLVVDSTTARRLLRDGP